MCLARDSAVAMTEDVREQLLEASSATKKAFNSYRREADSEDHFNSADGQPSAGDKNQDDGEMSFVIVIMQPILRFLQLLCENHNRDLQVGRDELQSHSPDTAVSLCALGFTHGPQTPRTAVVVLSVVQNPLRRRLPSL